MCYGLDVDHNEPRWADIDADWADKERRATDARAANARAAAAGEPLPYPNPWDVLDSTKIPAGEEATPARLRESYLAFRRICRLPPCKRHVI